jgi:hypothetical protein
MDRTMETVIGFVVGYVVGTREGRAGFEKMVSSFDAIRRSEELRRMVGTAVATATPVLRQLAGGGAAAMVGSVVDELTRRAVGTEPDRHAA